MVNATFVNTPARAKGPVLRDAYSLPFGIGGSDYVPVSLVR